MASTELQRYDLPWALRSDQWVMLPDGTVRRPLNMDDFLFWRIWGHQILGWWSIKVTNLPEHGCYVSTCFLGLDHDSMLGWDWSDFMNPKPPEGYLPLVFETMVFGGKHHLSKTRTRHLLLAAKDHDEMVRMVKEETEDAYKCPRCGMVSHNPNDAASRYCGICHRFEDDPDPEDLADEAE